MSADQTGAAFKLRAEDADDLAVISSCLQDALVAVRDLAFVQQDLTFLMVANRFRWERAPRSAPGETGDQRTLCGITFGATIIYVGEAFDPLAALETIQEEKCDSLGGVPKVFIAVLNHPAFSRFDLSSLRKNH